VTLRLSGGRKLLSPPGSTARPTTSQVRQAVMNLIAADLPGASWLDLCCGSGVMGCEALVRGAAVVVAVDQDRQMAATAAANLATVQAGLSTNPLVRVLCRSLPRWLELGTAQREAELGLTAFDLIYLDLPYGSGQHGVIGEALARCGWLAPGGRLILECGSKGAIEVPADWRLVDRRRYGGTSLMLLSRGHRPDGIDSMPPRTAPQS
jgi:16S rRNA (guanine(966)-N(2))-methyltransferase RsmD